MRVLWWLWGLCLHLPGVSFHLPLSVQLSGFSPLPHLPSSISASLPPLSFPPYFCHSVLSLALLLGAYLSLSVSPSISFLHPINSLSLTISLWVFSSLPIFLGLSFSAPVLIPVSAGLFSIWPVSLSSLFYLFSPLLYLLWPHYPFSLCFSLRFCISPFASVFPCVSPSITPTLLLPPRLSFLVSPLHRVSPCLCRSISRLSFLSLSLLRVSAAPSLRTPPPTPCPFPGALALRGRPAGPAGDARRRWPPRPSGPR